MIRSFRSKSAAALFHGQSTPKHQGFARVAQRKLKQLNAARDLTDMAIFPGNRLEALKGDRAGQYSVRINQQYRICFLWRQGDAYDVEIVDYH